MNQNRVTLEHVLFALAFGLALSVRLVQLGAAPLSEAEARWALQALSLARGEFTVVGPNPAYVLVTSLSFALFPSTDFLARLWPAFTGSLLVLLPVMFRRELGRPAALLMAFGLALDPGLVAVSRVAGGPMPALALGLLALGAVYHRRPAWAGVLGGLVLLSGPAVLFGALGLLLAWALWAYLQRTAKLPGPDTSFDPPAGTVETFPRRFTAPDFSRPAMLALVLVLAFGGTLLMRVPQALGAMVEALPVFFAGWLSSGDVPALRLVAGLAVYQPLALIFGLVHVIRVWFIQPAPAAPGRWLSLALLALLGLGLVYPQRAVSDLVWVLVPLWGLAALELSRHLVLRNEVETNVIAAGQGVLVLILAAFMWVNLASVARVLPAHDVTAMRTGAGLVLGALVMVALTTGLVATGWNWPTARLGLVWGSAAALGMYMLSAMISASQVRPALEAGFWSPSPAAGQADLLVQTLDDLSGWHTGMDRSLEIMVLSDLPSLHWTLRDWPQARFLSELNAGDAPSPSLNSLPPVVITRLPDEPEHLLAAYRGQDFAWQVYPDWQGALPPSPVRFLVTRTAPQRVAQVVVWVRSDVFPLGQAVIAAGDNLVPDEPDQPIEVIPGERLPRE